MRENIEYLEDLLRKVPEVRGVYDEHVRDNGSMLPHVLMGGISRFVVEAVEKPEAEGAVRRIIEHLERGLSSGVPEVEELVVVSFVENLIGEARALAKLRTFMGGALSGQIERICGS